MSGARECPHGVPTDTCPTCSVFQPDRYEQLVTAVLALLPEVESEIEQRKHGGLDEDWKPLQALVDDVRKVLP